MIGQANKHRLHLYFYRNLKIFKNFHKARKNPENKVKPEKKQKVIFYPIIDKI